MKAFPRALALTLGLSLVAPSAFAQGAPAEDKSNAAAEKPLEKAADKPADLPDAHRDRGAHRWAHDRDRASEPKGFLDRVPQMREMIRLHAGPLEIAPVVLMQVQAIPYVGSDAFLQAGDPAERGGFRFRRARFGFDGRLYRRLAFRISGEFNSDVNAVARLHDGWFGYNQYKFFQVYVGAHDVPFSRYALAPTGNISLIERPFAVRAMAPFSQLGVHVEGHLFGSGLSYYAGVYNALERTQQFFQGYTANAAVLGNRFEGLTYAGRLESAPLGPVSRNIQDLDHGKLRVAAGASVFYSNGGTRNILGAGGDFLLQARGVHVLAEFLANRSDPTLQPTQPTTQVSNLTSYGIVGEIGYVIVRSRFGATARFEWLDPNTGVKDESDSWVLGGGLSYHLFHDAVKAQVDYMHREERHGLSLKNDSVVLQLQLNL